MNSTKKTARMAGLLYLVNGVTGFFGIIYVPYFRRSSRRPQRRLWCAGSIEQFVLAWTPIHRFRLGWMRTPNFALSSGEPDAYRKTHVRFGERR